MAPISGNYNFRDPSMYMNHAKNLTTSYVKGGSQGIGNYLNGQMDSYVSNTVNGTVDNLTGNMNPYVKMAVKSALSILMAWIKGQDKREADNAKTEGNVLSEQMRGVADQGRNETEGLKGQAQQDIDGQTQTIKDNKGQIDANNEESNALRDENTEKTDENKGLDDKAKQIQEEQRKILEQIKQLQAKKNVEVVKFGDNTPKSGGVKPGDNQAEGTSVPPMLDPSLTEGCDPEIAELINKYNALNEDFGAVCVGKKQNTETITKNNETIATKNQENEERYQNIDAAGETMVSLYDQYSGAMQNVQDIVTGKQKMFTPEMIMKAAEQMAMSAINGTEGGVLAAAAAAMGASSIVSFGATASEAARYAEASADKFSSIAPRILASTAIKIAQATAQAYVQQALANISQIAGVDLNEIYNTGMEIYNQASAENPNKTDLASNDDGKDKKAEETKKDEKPKTNMA